MNVDISSVLLQYKKTTIIVQNVILDKELELVFLFKYLKDPKYFDLPFCGLGLLIVLDLPHREEMKKKGITLAALWPDFE